MAKNGLKDMLKLSFGEEVFNAVSHGVMILVMLCLIPFGAVYSYTVGGTLRAVGVSIFTICIFLMFLSSTLYHTMAFDSPHKVVFRILDHICIYLAIAGSYTPVALCVIQGWEGTVILIIQWLMVFIGILYKTLSPKSLPKLSLTIYLVMGWSVILFLPVLLRSANFTFLMWIVAGGLLYSVGAYFYSRKWAYAHAIWHIFIALASICHLIGIIFYM
ncbi:hemolysin III [Erysipelotrichaceae bacterium MTC7]|nr:hemolysin III [Erysipelotrichaceae bacterium MTC7]